MSGQYSSWKRIVVCCNLVLWRKLHINPLIVAALELGVNNGAHILQASNPFSAAIEKEWKKERKQIKQQLLNDGKPLIIGGDGRADSPGHSAKFGTYTAIDLISNKIVDIQLVQAIANLSSALAISYYLLLCFYFSFFVSHWLFSLL